MSTVYPINKGINRSIEFKGVKAQYIIYLAVGLVVLLLLFAILYLVGFSIYICLAVILPAGGVLIMGVQTMSKKYGAHGLVKKLAQNRLPSCIISRSRTTFTHLKTSTK